MRVSTHYWRCLHWTILATQVLNTHQWSLPGLGSSSDHLTRRSVSGSSTQVQLQLLQCQHYSFDFTFQSAGVSGPAYGELRPEFRQANLTGIADEADDDDDVGYETFNVTYVDPTDYSEASYNSVLFPFLHPFKDAASNDTEADEFVTEKVSYDDLLKYDVLEKLEGCYSYVVPYLTLSVESHQSEVNQTTTTEAEQSLDKYVQLYEGLHDINDGFDGSIKYNRQSHLFVTNMIGSYFGVVFTRDMSVMKCYMQEKLPKSFEELTAHFLTIQIEKPLEAGGETGGFVSSLVSRSTSVLSSWLPSYVPLVTSITSIQDTEPAQKMLEALQSWAPSPRSLNIPQFRLPCSNSLTNKCWQQTLSSLQQYLSTENIQSALNYMLPTMNCLHQLFDMMSDMMKFIAATEDFTCLSCSYDIIANDKLDWDSNKPTFAGKSLMYEIVKPLGRDIVTELPLKIKKTYENIEANHNDQRLMALMGELRNRTSHIVQSKSLGNVIQQKLSDVLEWIGEIDVEAVQLNGLLFVNAVTNCLTNQDEVAVGPLVDIILDKIHGDEFWVILDDLVVNVVNQRWLRVLAVVEHQLTPALQRLALGLDWLNIDFQRNIRHMVERAVSTIQEKLEGLEGPWPWSFSLASLVSRSPEVLQCSKESVSDEDVWSLVRLSYTLLTAGLDYLEPTFGLFQPSSVCRLLQMCEGTSSEVSQAGSEMRQKMIEVFTPLMGIKRAVFCRDAVITKHQYWGSILQ